MNRAITVPAKGIEFTQGEGNKRVSALILHFNLWMFPSDIPLPVVVHMALNLKSKKDKLHSDITKQCLLLCALLSERQCLGCIFWGSYLLKIA